MFIYNSVNTLFIFSTLRIIKSTANTIINAVTINYADFAKYKIIIYLYAINVNIFLVLRTYITEKTAIRKSTDGSFDYFRLRI